MTGQKFTPGERCPNFQIAGVGGKQLTLSEIAIPGNWKLIVFYRGLHCPFCISYIKELNDMRASFAESNVQVLAVSADPLEKASRFAQENGIEIELGYDISIRQMNKLGLYISDPANDAETDRPFCEPGLFVVNAEGLVHILDISNAPFSRPELQKIKRALDYIRLPKQQRQDTYDANYPIRGRHGV